MEYSLFLLYKLLNWRLCWIKKHQWAKVIWILTLMQYKGGPKDASFVQNGHVLVLKISTSWTTWANSKVLGSCARKASTPPPPMHASARILKTPPPPMPACALIVCPLTWYKVLQFGPVSWTCLNKHVLLCKWVICATPMHFRNKLLRGNWELLPPLSPTYLCWIQSPLSICQGLSL